MKTLSNIIILLSMLIVLGLLALYLLQSKLIYPAPEAPLKVLLPDNVSKVDLELSDGFLLMPKLSGNELLPLMIFSHGNGELASSLIDDFKPLLESNIAVLIVEYPGYGGSTIKTDINSINETMLKAFDVASKLPQIDKNKIFSYGRSIGGGAAALLTKQRPLAALCLESTFSSFPKLVSEKGFPSFLVRDRYENEDIIKKLDIPIFLYHGLNDELIPFEHAESLASAAKDVVFYSENCGHNNCPRKWDELLDFLKLNKIL